MIVILRVCPSCGAKELLQTLNRGYMMPVNPECTCPECREKIIPLLKREVFVDSVDADIIKELLY